MSLRSRGGPPGVSSRLVSSRLVSSLIVSSSLLAHGDLDDAPVHLDGHVRRPGTAVDVAVLADPEAAGLAVEDLDAPDAGGRVDCHVHALRDDDLDRTHAPVDAEAVAVEPVHVGDAGEVQGHL